MEQTRPGAAWAESSDSAQWTVIGGLGTAILLLTLIATLLVITGHRRAGLFAILLHAAASVPLGALLGTAHSGQGWGTVTIVAPAAGLITVLVAGTRWRAERPPPALTWP